MKQQALVSSYHWSINATSRPKLARCESTQCISTRQILRRARLFLRQYPFISSHATPVSPSPALPSDSPKTPPKHSPRLRAACHSVLPSQRPSRRHAGHARQGHPSGRREAPSAQAACAGGAARKGGRHRAHACGRQHGEGLESRPQRVWDFRLQGRYSHDLIA